MNDSELLPKYKRIKNRSKLHQYQHRWQRNNQMWRTFVNCNYNSLCLWIGIAICCFIGNTFAGFACLSNPCVFGVCIDDLNR